MSKVMNKVITISGLVSLLLNILAGAMLSCYDKFHVEVSSAIIVITCILLLVINSISLKDGFKVSTTILYTIAGIVEFVIALMMPSHFSDNMGLMAIIALIVFQCLLLVIVHTISAKIK